MSAAAPCKIKMSAVTLNSSETFISRFLQIICNEINLVFNQIGIFYVCFTIHGEDRGVRSVKNRKQFFSLNF